MRPRTRGTLALAAAACAVGSLAPATGQAAAPRIDPPVPLSPDLAPVQGGDVLRELNRVRRLRGLRALRSSAPLRNAARAHTLAMGRRGFFSHSSPNGAPFWRRIERFYPSAGYGSWAVGENLAWDDPAAGPSGIVRTWLASPEHRANLLSRTWHEIGLAAVTFPAAPGVYRGRRVTIVTADFGARAG